MGEIRFDPASWDDGARRVAATAQEFIASTRGVLDNCTDLGRLGCNNGGTLADAALGMIFPALFQAVTETINGLAQGLAGEANNMQVTGENYRAAEEAGVQLAGQIMAE